MADPGQEVLHPPIVQISLSAVDMFSDEDIPPVFTTENPLDFDDLLDIAREFEFTRTITHIWPCEEPSPCTETGLEDLFAAIVPTINTEESPLPLSRLSPICPDPVQESAHPTSDADVILMNMAQKDDDQARVEVETSMLQGWFPPDGSQFLDLDDGLALPQPVKDVWVPPVLADSLAPPYTQPTSTLDVSSAIGDVPLATEPKDPPRSTIDDPGQQTVPLVPLPTGRVVPELVPDGSPLGDANAPSQTIITPRAKVLKPRTHPSGPSTASYAKAPRGGIPPHIARTVTKANILRIEKERKLMQDAFSTTATGEGKRPSVLRRAGKGENECGRGNGKKTHECGHSKEGRAAKRAKV